MKKLTLIRHAKSSHEQSLVQDFHRPLSGRGLHDAPLIGQHLKKNHAFTPDYLLTSPAKRARTTAEIVLRKAGIPFSGLQEEPRIYEAPLQTLVEVVRGLPDESSHTVIFGHNPGLESLANWLCGRRAISGLRTGGVILLELAVDGWAGTHGGCATLLHYFYPALIGGGKDAYGR